MQTLTTTKKNFGWKKQSNRHTRTHKMKMGNGSIESEHETAFESTNKKNISEIFDSSEKVLDEEIPTLHGYGWISRVLNNENSLVRIVMTRTKAIYTGTNRNWNSPQKYLK